MILDLLTSLQPAKKDDAGAFDTLEEIKDGEEVVGELDGHVLALWICLAQQKEAYKLKVDEVKNLRRVQKEAPTETNLRAANEATIEANGLSARIARLNEVFWDEVVESFPACLDHSIGVRKGFKIVRYKAKPEPHTCTHTLVFCMSPGGGFPFGPPSDEDPRS